MWVKKSCVNTKTLKRVHPRCANDTYGHFPILPQIKGKIRFFLKPFTQPKFTHNQITTFVLCSWVTDDYQRWIRAKGATIKMSMSYFLPWSLQASLQLDSVNSTQLSLSLPSISLSLSHTHTHTGGRHSCNQTSLLWFEPLAFLIKNNLKWTWSFGQGTSKLKLDTAASTHTHTHTQAEASILDIKMNISTFLSLHVLCYPVVIRTVVLPETWACGSQEANNFRLFSTIVVMRK